MALPVEAEGVSIGSKPKGLGYDSPGEAGAAGAALGCQVWAVEPQRGEIKGDGLLPWPRFLSRPVGAPDSGGLLPRGAPATPASRWAGLSKPVGLAVNSSEALQPKALQGLDLKATCSAGGSLLAALAFFVYRTCCSMFFVTGSCVKSSVLSFMQ